MTEIILGTIKPDVQPASLSGATLSVSRDGNTYALSINNTIIQYITKDILIKLNQAGVIVWLSDQHRLAVINEQPVQSGGWVEESPMLSTPTSYTPLPEAPAGQGIIWRILTIIMPIITTTVLLFFLFAIFVSDDLSIQAVFSSFGVIGLVLSMVSGFLIGIGIDLLINRKRKK